MPNLVICTRIKMISTPFERSIDSCVEKKETRETKRPKDMAQETCPGYSGNLNIFEHLRHYWFPDDGMEFLPSWRRDPNRHRDREGVYSRPKTGNNNTNSFSNGFSHKILQYYGNHNYFDNEDNGAVINTSKVTVLD